MPDHVPELLQTVIVGMLADDELLVTVVARHPAGVDIVRATDHGVQADPGAVHRHVVHAVVVQVVGGVDSCQVLVRARVELCGHGELLLKWLPTWKPEHSIT